GIYCSDNGELKSESLRDWLLTRGIQHQFTVLNTSAHNVTSQNFPNPFGPIPAPYDQIPNPKPRTLP
ncbi:hypothetical protein BS17DRAFT_689937, partial [Gyrodon lividus]